MSVSHQALISLAILKSDLDDERRDYLGYLESLVIPVLKNWPDEPVTDASVAKEFENVHGLRVPDRTIQLVLKRLAKSGYLVRSHGTFSISKDLPSTSIDQKKVAAEQHIDKVLASLQNYAQEVFGIDWSWDNVEAAIIGFLDHFGIECLRTYIFRSSLPEVPESAPTEQFVTGSFIQNIYHTDKNLFDSVVVLIKGQMYGNVLTCPDLEGLGKNFKSVTFYFDTPLILNLLNLQGEQEFESVVELVSLLRRLKARLAIFEHTASELETVLNTSAENIENPKAIGRVVREMRRLGLKKGDIILKVSKYEEELKEYGIRVVNTPEYRGSLQIDEAALESEIGNHLSYRNERAREFDINSVRSIYSIRKGAAPRRLEDCVGVLVTNNEALAKAAFAFGKKYESTSEVSSIITDFSLANIAWLKSPMDAPNLPVKETIAVCYAAMEPSSGLWEKYLNEIDKLEKEGGIGPDEHAVLRISNISEHALMDMTLGDEKNLRGDTVSAILERVKEDFAQERSVEVNRERQEHESTKRRLREELEGRKRLEAKIERICIRISNTVYYVALICAIVILFLGMMAGSGLIPVYFFNSLIATAALNTFILVSVFVGSLSAIFGTTIKQVVDKWRRGLARILTGWVKNLIGI